MKSSQDGSNYTIPSDSGLTKQQLLAHNVQLQKQKKTNTMNLIPYQVHQFNQKYNMHRQASELKIHEEMNEEDDDLEEESIKHQISRASPETKKKRSSVEEFDEKQLIKLKESQEIPRPEDKKSGRKRSHRKSSATTTDDKPEQLDSGSIG